MVLSRRVVTFASVTALVVACGGSSAEFVGIPDDGGTSADGGGGGDGASTDGTVNGDGGDGGDGGGVRGDGAPADVAIDVVGPTANHIPCACAAGVPTACSITGACCLQRPAADACVNVCSPSAGCPAPDAGQTITLQCANAANCPSNQVCCIHRTNGGVTAAQCLDAQQCINSGSAFLCDINAAKNPECDRFKAGSACEQGGAQSWGLPAGAAPYGTCDGQGPP